MGNKQVGTCDIIATERRWPRRGATWTTRERSSGSFGTHTRLVEVRSLGTVHLNGSPTVACEYNGLEPDSTLTVYFSMDGSMLRLEDRGNPISIYTPGLQLFTWPLRIGATWSAKFTYEDADGNVFADNPSTGTVEAIEEVETPAGSFSTVRISILDPNTHKWRWYDPELGMYVRQLSTRLPQFYLGKGEIEHELVAYSDS